jgi:hypothetical protein
MAAAFAIIQHRVQSRGSMLIGMNGLVHPEFLNHKAPKNKGECGPELTRERLCWVGYDAQRQLVLGGMWERVGNASRFA